MKGARMLTDKSFPNRQRILFGVVLALLLFICLSLFLLSGSMTVRVLSAMVALAALFAGGIILMGDKYIKWTLIMPSIVIMLAVTIVPLIFLLVMSVHDVKLFNFNKEWNFVGFDNYIHFFKNDKLFWPAVVRTVEYTVLALLIQLILGLGLAMLFQQAFRYRNLVSSFLVIPVMTCPIVIAMLWKSMMNAETGIFNNMLRALGFNGINYLTNEPVQWIAAIPLIGDFLVKYLNANVGFVSLLVINTWQWTPFVFLMILSGINSLSKEPFEAAYVDGATPFQVFRCITLPLLKPVMQVVILMRLIDLMKVYDQIYALFGDNITMRTLNIHIFSVGLTQQNYGRGSALSIIVLILITCISKLLMFFNEKIGERRGAR